MVVQLRTVSGADPAVDDGPAREPHWRRPARQAGLIALGALCLMLAILVNGRPTVFSDTADYFSQARSIVRDAHDAIYKNKPIVSREMFEDHFGRDDQGDEEPIHNELGARSPYYGMFLYTLHRIGTMWLVAAAQAAIIAAAVYGLWRLTLPQAHPRTYLMAMAVLAIGTPLPFIAGFAVPDALTGVAATGGMIFLLYADRLSLTARIVLLAGLAFCFNAHASHIATGLALIICTAALLLFFRYDRRAIALRAACIAGAIAAAMTASAAYAFLVHLRTGDDLRSPPFLSIRVIADGPGREYLRHSCAQDPKKWEMCRFSKLPLRESNTLMWSVDPKVAVFNVSDYGQRDRMERQDLAFALHTIAYDPIGQLGASLKNWWLQFFSISLNEVQIDPYYYLKDKYWSSHLAELILGPGPCPGHSCKPRLPERMLRWTEWAIIGLTMGFLGWRMSRFDVRHAFMRRNFEDPKTQALIVVVLLLAAAIINAGVCGILSGVFGRYQARIVWLILLAGLMALEAWGLKPRPKPHLEVVHAPPS